MSNSNKSRLPKFRALKTKRENQKLTKKGSNIQINQIQSMISTWMMKNYFNKKQIVCSSCISGSFYTSTTLKPQIWPRSTREKWSAFLPTKKFIRLCKFSTNKNFVPLKNKSKVARTLLLVNLLLEAIYSHTTTSEEKNNSSISWASRNWPYSNFCKSK